MKLQIQDLKTKFNGILLPIMDGVFKGEYKIFTRLYLTNNITIYRI